MTAPAKDNFVLVAEIHDPDLTSSLEVAVCGLVLRYRRTLGKRSVTRVVYYNAMDPKARPCKTASAAERVIL